jgi:hypothetical protein
VLEDRRLLACGIFQRGSTLLILGDNRPNAITIQDSGLTGDITVTCDGVQRTFGRIRPVPVGVREVREFPISTFDFGAGTVFQFPFNLADGAFARPPLTNPVGRAITQIAIDTRGGNDIVSYSLVHDLRSVFTRTVVADLGRGDDAFLVDVSDRLIAGSLRFFIDGDGDRDTLRVAALDTDIARRGVLGIDLTGGRDYDYITVGRLSTFVQGGDFTDNIEVDVLTDGFSARAPVVFVDGGRGDDFIAVDVEASLQFTTGPGRLLRSLSRGTRRLSLNALDRLFARTELFAFVDGGQGFDTCAVTPNVATVSCP